MLEILQKSFFENIEKHKPFDNKEQVTYMNKKPRDGQLKVVTAIIKTYFHNLKDVRYVTFDDMNPVVLKEYIKDVKYTKVRKGGPMESK